MTAGSTSLFAEKAVKPFGILILGGTGFTGPYQVRYALSRGHKGTAFNRGKTHPGELPAEVEQLVGDRNGKLDALKNRQWDVVIDNPTTLPAGGREAAQFLKGNDGAAVGARVRANLERQCRALRLHLHDLGLWRDKTRR